MRRSCRLLIETSSAADIALTAVPWFRLTDSTVLGQLVFPRFSGSVLTHVGIFVFVGSLVVKTFARKIQAWVQG